MQIENNKLLNSKNERGRRRIKAKSKEDRIKQKNQLFFATVIFYIGSAFLLSKISQDIAFPLWFSLLLGVILMMIPTITYYVFNRENPFKRFRFNSINLLTIFLTVVLALCVMPIFMLINAVSAYFTSSATTSVFNSLSLYSLPLQLLLIAVIPGFCEEFVFRGVYYSEYREKNVWRGILLSALLFGFMHLNINQLSYAFPMGIVFALLIEATDSIFTSIIAHTTFNGTSILLQYLVNTNGSDGLDAEGILDTLPQGTLFITYFILFIAGIIGLVLAALLFITLAKENGRYDYIRKLFRRKLPVLLAVNGVQVKKRILDIWIVLALIVCIVYMML